MNKLNRVLDELRTLCEGPALPDEISAELLADLRAIWADLQFAYTRSLPFTVQRIRGRYYDD
ncbi:MAG: hypothetical protein MJE77_22655 [Proteobacteria bacterium]|nr:hypothetical protein [Pseudomonadota bacterium]